MTYFDLHGPWTGAALEPHAPVYKGRYLSPASRIALVLACMAVVIGILIGLNT